MLQIHGSPGLRAPDTALSLQCSPDPLAGFRGRTPPPGKGRGKGWNREGAQRRGEGKGEEEGREGEMGGLLHGFEGG